MGLLLRVPSPRKVPQWLYRQALILLHCCHRLRALLTPLEVALEREVEGDLFLHDIGQGFGFRPGTFDGCIRYAPDL